MTPQPANKQEAIVKMFAERSMSATRVFITDRYGPFAREPCDLLFANHDSAILMFMAQQDVVRDSREKNLNTLHKKINHNLGQARGALRRWRDGHSITGTNAYGSLYLPFDSTKRIAVFSITDCRESIFKRHRPEEAKWGVDLCVTIPESSFRTLIDCHCTMTDIVRFSKETESETPGPELITKVREYALRSAESAKSRTDFQLQSKDLFQHIHQDLMSLRTTGVADDALHGLSDIEWSDLLVLNANICAAIEKCHANGVPMLSSLSFRRYEFRAYTVPALSPLFTSDVAGKQRAFFAEMREGRVGWGLFFFVVANLRWVSFIVAPNMPDLPRPISILAEVLGDP